MAQTHQLPGDLNIYAVGPLRTQFESWLAKLPKGRRAQTLNDTPLTVDAAGVNEVDAAGVQLLLSLSKSLAARRRPLQLINPSRPLAGALQTLGVSALLLGGSDAGSNA